MPGGSAGGKRAGKGCPLSASGWRATGAGRRAYRRRGLQLPGHVANVLNASLRCRPRRLCDVHVLRTRRPELLLGLRQGRRRVATPGEGGGVGSEPVLRAPWYCCTATGALNGGTSARDRREETRQWYASRWHRPPDPDPRTPDPPPRVPPRARPTKSVAGRLESTPNKTQANPGHAHFCFQKSVLHQFQRERAFEPVQPPPPPHLIRIGSKGPRPPELHWTVGPRRAPGRTPRAPRAVRPLCGVAEGAGRCSSALGPTRAFAHPGTPQGPADQRTGPGSP